MKMHEATMQFHTNTDPLDVAQWLRDEAARRGVRPTFLYALDDMLEAIDRNSEIVELEEANGQLEHDCASAEVHSKERQ